MTRLFVVNDEKFRDFLYPSDDVIQNELWRHSEIYAAALRQNIIPVLWKISCKSFLSSNFLLGCHSQNVIDKHGRIYQHKPSKDI
jgi:hypothetical protein